MTILILGAPSYATWTRSVLDVLRERCTPGAAPVVRLIDEPPSRELLASLAEEPDVDLVLADHFPFADGLPDASLALTDAVRGQAYRAVLALELARRAVRVLAV